MWRIGSAAFGALLLARFVLGTPQCSQRSHVTGHQRNRRNRECGNCVYRVGGKSSFFSLVRGFQLLGLIVCIASHLVVFQALLKKKQTGTTRDRNSTHAPIALPLKKDLDDAR